MNPVLRKQFLHAELGEVDALLRELSPRRVLERVGLEQRRVAINDELGKLSGGDKSAKVILAFDGPPVAGSVGIDATFAGKAIQSFQALVSRVDASGRPGTTLRSRGAVPGAKKSALLVTGVVHGSFGFELEEVGQLDMLPTSLASSVQTAASLVSSAASSDEAFLDQIADTDKRVLQALVDFVQVVRTSHASCKLLGEHTDVVLDPTHVEQASVRTRNVSVDESIDDVEGTFLGGLLESRRFEFESSEGPPAIKGKIDADVPLEEIGAWVDDYYARFCVAKIRFVTTKSGARTTVRATLLALTPTDSFER